MSKDHIKRATDDLLIQLAGTMITQAEIELRKVTTLPDLRTELLIHLEIVSTQIRHYLSSQ